MKKAGLVPGLSCLECGCDYSRLPKSESSIMNMLMKSR
ncbi:hypothetical protein CLV78_10490 [Aliiruegeria haliotis]|uniref:Uncharacterized protein n=1 Tax=Aliiruegeria haliotis TaxID=1280846 RepID=A0A2T0RR70_9RHOB|nr:hypothetical protein CLV78_10490 [Aliiruegeria haliotis]